MRLFCKIGLAIALMIELLPNPGRAATRGALKAQRVDITPDATAIPPPYTSILDPLYARAIYLKTGIIGPSC